MRVTTCDRLSAIYLQRGMHLFAALTRMLPSLIDIARSRISGSGSPSILPTPGETVDLSREPFQVSRERFQVSTYPYART